MDELILSRQQVRECDRKAVERFGISSLVLMENAGSGAVCYILDRLRDKEGRHVLVLAGPGNNGGDGFVVARHLMNAGVDVEVLVLVEREKVKGDARTNLEIAEKMNIPVDFAGNLPVDELERQLQKRLEQTAVIIDAMLGTGTSGPPRQPFRTAIEKINCNRSDKTIVALDIPSGLDCDTGEPLEIAVRADYTITFAAMKKGVTTESARQYTGDVMVAGIGITARLLQ